MYHFLMPFIVFCCVLPAGAYTAETNSRKPTRPGDDRPMDRIGDRPRQLAGSYG